MANRPTIVSTVFGGGGDEQLKVTDVYKAESGSNALLNDYVSSVTQGSNDMLSRLKGDNTSLSDLVDLIDIEDGAIKGNQNAIGRRAKHAIKNVIWVIGIYFLKPPIADISLLCTA